MKYGFLLLATTCIVQEREEVKEKNKVSLEVHAYYIANARETALLDNSRSVGLARAIHRVFPKFPQAPPAKIRSESQEGQNQMSRGFPSNSGISQSICCQF